MMVEPAPEKMAISCREENTDLSTGPVFDNRRAAAPLVESLHRN